MIYDFRIRKKGEIAPKETKILYFSVLFFNQKSHFINHLSPLIIPEKEPFWQEKKASALGVVPPKVSAFGCVNQSVACRSMASLSRSHSYFGFQAILPSAIAFATIGSS